MTITPPMPVVVDVSFKTWMWPWYLAEEGKETCFHTKKEILLWKVACGVTFHDVYPEAQCNTHIRVGLNSDLFWGLDVETDDIS